MVLKNVKKEADVSLVRSLSKSIGGAFINELKVASHDIPGNFGVRVIETMPTNIRDVFVKQYNNLELEYKCDYRYQEVPEVMEAPDQNDYLTDEESDDAPEFEVKVPDLDSLINEFESADPEILEFKEEQTNILKDLEQRGFEPEARQDIRSKEQERVDILNKNISMQRQQ